MAIAVAMTSCPACNALGCAACDHTGEVEEGSVGMGSTIEDLEDHARSWREGQKWEFRTLGEREWKPWMPKWSPAWFYSTEYRRVS